MKKTLLIAAMTAMLSMMNLAHAGNNNGPAYSSMGDVNTTNNNTTIRRCFRNSSTPTNCPEYRVSNCTRTGCMPQIHVIASPMSSARSSASTPIRARSTLPSRIGR